MPKNTLSRILNHKDNRFSHIYDSQILCRQIYGLMYKMKVNMKLFMGTKKTNQSGKVCERGDKRGFEEEYVQQTCVMNPLYNYPQWICTENLNDNNFKGLY